MRENLKTALARLKTPAFWLVLLFLAMLVVPGIVWDEMDAKFRARKLIWENRATRDKPTFQIRRFQRYPKEFGVYYNDAFPFREYLVWLSRKITGPLNNFFSAKVIIGKEGYLFTSDPTYPAQDESRDYIGATLWNGAMEASVVKKLEHTRCELAKMNIEFIVVIAPNKMTVYDDMLPEKRRFRKTPVTRAASLVACAARTAPELKIKYLADVFRETRGKIKYPLFLLEDTHWNELGGYLATREVVNALTGCAELPPIESMRIVKTSTTRGGDLRVMLGGGTPGEDQQYKVMIPGTKTVKIIEPVDFHFRKTFNPDAPDKRRVWVYRDSFAAAMESYFGMLFKDVSFYWHVYPQRIHFAKSKPDIVVLEVVERALGGLENLDFESSDDTRLELFR